MAVRVVAGAHGVAVLVEHRVEAAEGHLVADRPAAELLRHREDVRLLAVEERRDPRGVDGAGADRGEGVVLADDLFDEEFAPVESPRWNSSQSSMSAAW